MALYCSSLQRDLSKVGGCIRLQFVLNLFLSTLYRLPRCLANELAENDANLSLADSDSSVVNGSHCGGRPWLIGSDCHRADSLNGIIYCDSSGEVFAKSQYCMSLYGEEEVASWKVSLYVLNIIL